MELAYRLAVSNEPRIQNIRDHVIVLINPVAEPDGRDRAVDWFYRHLKGKTDFDNLPPIDPPYWGKYVFHDNNRDLVQRKLALTRASEDAFLKWHPVVFHDLHESIPLLSIWTGTGPYNIHLDPITTSEWHAIAFSEVTELTSLGMPGVWTWGFGEGWSQIYADSVATNHNAIGRGYETFGNGTAETVERVIEKEEEYTGNAVTEPDWYRTLPPPKKFRWSLRDNTNYMETGVLAALGYTAGNGAQMMRNFWRRGRNAVRKGETEKPYAIVIPEKQADRRRLAAMVDLLRAHGIEVSRATAAFRVAEGSYPAGTFIVRMDQPYRGYALDLLTAQKYPADKALYPPYDDVAWALPFSYGIEVKAIGDAAVSKVPAAPVSAPVSLPGRVEGDGAVYLLADSGQEALLEARVRLGTFRLEAAEKAFSAGGRNYPAGSWVIPAQPDLRPALERTAADLSLDFEGGRVRAFGPPTRDRVSTPGGAPDLERHAVGGLGPDDLRRAEDPVHADHERGRARGEPRGALRRDPVSQHIQQPEGDRRRRGSEILAARVRAQRRLPDPGLSHLLAGHHGRPDVAGRGEPGGVRARRRPLHHARRRLDASAGRRHRARREPGLGQGVHAGQRADGALPAAGPSDRLRVSRRSPRSSARIGRCTGSGGPRRIGSCSSGERPCRKEDGDEDAGRGRDEAQGARARRQRRRQGRGRTSSASRRSSTSPRGRAASSPSTSTRSTGT